MKRSLVACTCLLVLTACDAAPEGQPVLRTEIGSGVAEEPTPVAAAADVNESADCKDATFEDIALVHCIADPADHRVEMVLGAESDNGIKPYRSFAALEKALGGSDDVAFAFNGGMFDEEGQPIGYYVESSERLVELNRAQGGGNFHLLPNGVFYGSDGKWSVRTADDFYSNVSDRPDFGTQSGPMLVVGGELHPEISQDGPSRHIRNAVGVDAEGRAHFVMSRAPLSFGKLARYYRDGLKVQNALYLDGSVSALWDPAAGRMDGLAPLGPLIVVTKRAKATP
ncbi:phosphodiester glycosidase family protein [Alteripontixanthobacter muriae]|uniref:phosphodiester glycosidase family protein n=1 Tax=Alteripontixanthobacter muriae TaxID=2705546 RepID=UPI002FC3C6CD